MKFSCVKAERWWQGVYRARTPMMEKRIRAQQ
jgi:hypothetical protein